MKPNIILLLWSILSFNALSAQADFHAIPDSVLEEKIYRLTEVQKPPTFPGGKPQLSKYVRKNLNYPTKAREDHVQGTVMATIVIEKDGTVSSVKIIKGIGSGCDEAVVKVISKMPKWNPGEYQGAPVRVLATLPIVFQLSIH